MNILQHSLVGADSCRACRQVDAGVVATVANRVIYGCTAVVSGSSSRWSRCSLYGGLHSKRCVEKRTNQSVPRLKLRKSATHQHCTNLKKCAVGPHSFCEYKIP